MEKTELPAGTVQEMGKRAELPVKAFRSDDAGPVPDAHELNGGDVERR